jgi:hypothetical protein
MTDPKEPNLKLVESLTEPAALIDKPPKFNIDDYKSEAAPIGGVETLLAALPHYPLPQANDFARLHPDEARYWSAPLCFANVPVKGQKRDTVHLISAKLVPLLPAKRVQRYRLALATLPYDVFFLCHVPEPNNANCDNSWVTSNLDACEQAKTLWIMAVSQKPEGFERYRICYTRAEVEKKESPYPQPRWPTQTLDELIAVTYQGLIITKESDPAFARLVGAKVSAS